MIQVDSDTARRTAVLAQGLGERIAGSLGDLVAETGFVRTLGGVDAYLALRARRRGLSREEVDRAVASRELQVLPSVRGCIYLVPRAHAALCLGVSARLSRRRNEREASKAGIREGELEKVGEAVLEILAKRGSLTTQALRRSLPEGLVRGLGEAGKKVGISSTLPPALRELEWAGRIHRHLEAGRLDTERYLWRLSGEEVAADETAADFDEALAEHYLRAAGLGTVGRFAAWSGLAKRAAREALETVAAESVGVAGSEEVHYALAVNDEALRSGAGGGRGVALLPFEDNLLALAGGLAAFVDPLYHDLEVPAWGRGKPQAIGEVRHSSFRSVLAGDRIVGFWEFDPDQGRVEVGCFASPSEDLLAEVERQAASTGTFLASELANAKSFSIDTEKAMRRRCGMIRALAERSA